MNELKFYECSQCGNIIEIIHPSGIKVECCNETMKKLYAKTEDEGKEKHIPVLKVFGNNLEVTIGDIPHPMEKEHYINWIVLKTDKGVQRKCLNPGDLPRVIFRLADDEKVEAVYSYCNIHGLWVKCMNS